jgi:hypothetical protein
MTAMDGVFGNPVQNPTQNAYPGYNMQGMKACHEKVQPEKQGIAVTETMQYRRSRIQTVFNFGRPFEILIYKKNQAYQNGGADQEKCEFFVSELDGRDRHGNGHAADEQQGSVCGSHGKVELFGSQMERRLR